MNYDFSQLDDKEFEVFVNDLLEKIYNTKIDRFKPGKDKGIDGKFFYDNGKIAIIQTKKYLKTGYDGLIRSLKSSELQKVKDLFIKGDLNKYIFVTDLPLSNKNKEEIKNIFSPYIESTNDIFGKENLNSVLSENQDIERKYYRLWISSTTVLQNILNNAIIGRSEFQFEQIIEKSKYFIEISSFNDALKRLENDNVIIITGEPGIGKTTLSENLCLKLVTLHDFKFYQIQSGILEAENIWNKDEKQLFYFDDFLGSNYFEAINNNQDSIINQFINRVKKDTSGKKKFILNSRSNILNYGINYSTIFGNSNIQKNEFLLEIKSLSDYEKAQILYKHIYYSDLDDEFIQEIYNDKNYFKIIKHDNFNPRLIEFITKKDRIKVDAKKYFNYLIEKLDNPQEVWRDAFYNQSNEYIRTLVKLVVFNGGTILEKELQKSYNNIRDSIISPTHKSKDFNFVINSAVKSFLNRNINSKNGVVSYNLFNPSISDFVINEFITNKNDLIILFSALESLTSIKYLNAIFNVSKNESVTYNSDITIFHDILKSLLVDNNSSRDLDFKYYLIKLCSEEAIYNEIVMKKLQEFIDSNDQEVEQYTFINNVKLIDKYLTQLNITSTKFIDRHFSGNLYSIDLDNLNMIGNLLDKLSQDYKIDLNTDLIYNFKEQIEYYLIEKIQDEYTEIDLNKFITKTYDEIWDMDYSYKESEIISELKGYIENYISDLSFDCIDKNSFDKSDIIYSANINIDGFVQDYLKENGDYDKENFSTHQNDKASEMNYDREIDYLFQRD